jgi:polar amino acid transport system permease protein
MIREFTLIDVYYQVLAARWTLALTAMAFAGGGFVGIVVALLRVAPFAPLRAVGTAYVTIAQGIPLLAWLFVLFFGLPILARYQVSPWIAAAIAFSIYAGAFLGEIWRGDALNLVSGEWSVACEPHRCSPPTTHDSPEPAA